MSKAEEIAKQLYADWVSTSNPELDGQEQSNVRIQRQAFLKGYHQAEKDLTGQAREAVETAREETLQEVKEKLLIMLNTSIDNKHFFEQLDDYIEELKEAIKDE